MCRMEEKEWTGVREGEGEGERAERGNEGEAIFHPPLARICKSHFPVQKNETECGILLTHLVEPFSTHDSHESAPI